MICCFFSSFKTFAMSREATNPPAAVNVLDVSSESMAAFGCSLRPRAHHLRLRNCWGEPNTRARQIGALCHHIYHQQGQLGVRRIHGVLSLAKRYGTKATEDACAAALEMGVREYRFVRRFRRNSIRESD